MEVQLNLPPRGVGLLLLFVKLSQVTQVQLEKRRNHMGDRLLTPKEAGAYLSRSESCLKLWRAKGTGPAYTKLNERMIRYRESDLLKWVEAGLKGGSYAL
jgi:predicted DNA-binding transcriptional regulator AlpA